MLFQKSGFRKGDINSPIDATILESKPKDNITSTILYIHSMDSFLAGTLCEG